MVASQVIDLVGQRFGKLKVIGRAANIGNGAGWLCECDCGRRVGKIRSGALRSGKKVHCGCDSTENRSRKKEWLPPGIAGMNSLYSRYRHGAKKRGLEFALTKEQFMLLTKSPCTYCGAPPSMICSPHSTHFSEAKANAEYLYTGIDRKDNALGYIFENCVPACKTCNFGKHTLTPQEFRAWLERIRDHEVIGTMARILSTDEMAATIDLMRSKGAFEFECNGMKVKLDPSWRPERTAEVFAANMAEQEKQQAMERFKEQAEDDQDLLMWSA